MGLDPTNKDRPDIPDGDPAPIPTGHGPGEPAPPPAPAAGASATQAAPAARYRFQAQPAGSAVDAHGRPAPGHAVSGAIDAPDTDTAQSSLAAMGLRVLSLEPEPTTDKPKALRGGDFAAFNQQLAHLTEAGMPMEQGLRLIAQDLKNGRLSATIERVAVELEQGKPLHEAFAAHRGGFPPLYGAIVEAGVKTGNLPAVLMGLGRHLELLQRLRSAVWRALAYPLVVLGGVLVMLGVLGAVLIPQFEEIFDDFQTDLPWLTVLVLDIGKAMPMIVVGLVVVVVLIAAGTAALRASGRGQVLLDRLLWVPLVGQAIRKNLLSRWCDALRLALHAGLDLPAALRLASETLGAEPLDRDTGAMVAALESGRGLRQGVALRFVPPAVPAAIELATHADDLPGMLEHLAAMYQQQAEQRVAALHQMLGPIMLVLVALVLGTIVWALFLPLVSLMQAVM